ncbi:MAG: alpha/beta hydrolase-fold protein [Bacteroidota bacterium]
MEFTVLSRIVKVKSKKEETENSRNSIIRSVTIDDFYSAALKRRVKMEVLLPPWYESTPEHRFPVIYINDGQSLKSIKMREALVECYERNLIPPVIIVGVFAHNRMQEYGVAATPDYKNRGGKANKYSRFLTNELVPLINKNFRTLTGAEYTSIAGFSLGGLSAFDIAWNNPEVFGSAGIFSGSFWWRSKDYKDGFDESVHRIAHAMVRNSKKREGLRLWFECGTQDEIADRNKNGVIDSIDDTLDLINELILTGYKLDQDLKYVEVVNGFHNESTWAEVMPLFLQFAFGKP